MKIDYAEKAKELRRSIITMLHDANGSFSGGALSCTDIITVLFNSFMRVNPQNPNDPQRDMFILSKGHCSSAMYAALVSVGLIPKNELKKYGKNGTRMFIHPKRGTYPGVEVSTGSLGHGLPLGTGSALAAKILGCDARVYVLMGDGECNEGSVWENAAFASFQKLNNLIVIVDRNGLQGCGRDSQILNYGDMGAKFRAFGFHTIDIDGHSYAEIENAFQQATTLHQDRPTAIIAHTVKGKGVSFMEDRLEWHYKSPDDEQFSAAMEELS
ncbi:MAG: transketolase [Oscillospiraceae bacterium]|nr:transketolase [Oscillospiraceae bacterium]